MLLHRGLKAEGFYGIGNKPVFILFLITAIVAIRFTPLREYFTAERLWGCSLRLRSPGLRLCA
jgi:hypothetical protein